jgi:riboflavin kinase/FMN adenylyltransferase
VPTINHPSLSQITIGSFDGLHAGHQTIIHHLVAGAHSQGQKAVLVTFYPNPTVFFKKIHTPFYLTTNSEKIALLQKLGIDETIILPFNQELAQSSAEDFIRYLLQRVPFNTMYIGYDFHFGADRAGDRGKLFELGKKYGFTVQVQQPVDLNATPISSSMIRSIISEGRVEDLSALLKRWYSMEGEVIHGDGRGKKMGIPTANIAYEPQKLLPPNGIYATRIQIGVETRPAATNVGFRPTFYETPSIKTVEAFILDWECDIYGKTVTLEFVRRLRDEIQYQNTQALTAQIRKDIALTRKIIDHE